MSEVMRILKFMVKDGEMNGQGTLTEIDGTKLTGQWENNKFIK